MKNKTQAAQAAALIRKEIKAAYPGLKFRCTSENYSGGNSIRVSYIDQPKEVHEAITAIAKKYQYGHFDGMHDIYEYSNSNPEIPQAKYVFTDNEMSGTKREELYQRLRTEWSGGGELPATYNEGRNVRFQGSYCQELVYRYFTGSIA